MLHVLQCVVVTLTSNSKITWIYCCNKDVDCHDSIKLTAAYQKKTDQFLL